jgi:hypothetical protein
MTNDINKWIVQIEENTDEKLNNEKISNMVLDLIDLGIELTSNTSELLNKWNNQNKDKDLQKTIKKYTQINATFNQKFKKMKQRLTLEKNKNDSTYAKKQLDVTTQEIKGYLTIIKKTGNALVEETEKYCKTRYYFWLVFFDKA